MVCAKEKKIRQGRGIGSTQGDVEIFWVRNLSDASEKLTFEGVREESVLLTGEKRLLSSAKVLRQELSGHVGAMTRSPVCSE